MNGLTASWCTAVIGGHGHSNVDAVNHLEMDEIFYGKKNRVVRRLETHDCFVEEISRMVVSTVQV